MKLIPSVLFHSFFDSCMHLYAQKKRAVFITNACLVVVFSVVFFFFCFSALDVRPEFTPFPTSLFLVGLSFFCFC